MSVQNSLWKVIKPLVLQALWVYQIKVYLHNVVKEGKLIAFLFEFLFSEE